MKKVLIFLVVIILIGAGIYYFTRTPAESPAPGGEENVSTSTPTTGQSTTTPVSEDKTRTVLGTSVGNRSITAYHYGDGEEEIIFVGGIHGGYEWNTALLAYELMDYLEADPTRIPENIKVTVIPVLNPDGLAKVVGTTTVKFNKSQVSKSETTVIAGRFNGNNVDLNRNFDCDWKAEGTWQNKTVSGGTAAFSEPESKAIRSYIETNDPTAVVVYYSAANGVFSSNCHNGVLPETQTLTTTYASASGYPAYREWGFYEITGDMVNWLAKEGIPAISVVLETHDSTEWTKNKAGIDAILAHYAENE